MIFLTSLKDTLIYHMGTLAFGSLLIAICKFVRFIIGQIEKRLKKAVGNKSKIVSCMITFVSCCCKCCLWCLEKFLKYVNRKAYIMCAIYGSNFCVSAISAFKLLLANPAKTLILDGVAFFLLLIGKLLITGAVGVLAFYLFTNSFNIPSTFSTYLAPTLHYYWLPLVTVIIGTFLIACLFLTVFEMAVDTVFLCALKDLDIHDGSPEKPYYMSKKLMEIMSKKNKPEKKKKKDNKVRDSEAKVEDVDEKI
jgi:solute carrier family 44 (choline transporter-like protein), member 2/4/5